MAVSSSQNESRVLVLAPTSRDAALTCDLLDRAGVASLSCRGVAELIQELECGAAVILLTEQVLSAPQMPELVSWLKAQPAWSDIPIVMLMHGGVRSPAAAAALSFPHNVTLLERPASKRSVVSVVKAAVRNRERQYRLRDSDAEREQLLASERAARVEAERAGRSKDEFLALLSHELKTPLNAIVMAAQLLELGDISEDEKRGMLQSILQNARVQNQLIEDLLDITRIVSGKLHLARTVFDLCDVTRAALATTRQAIEARQLDVSIELPAEPVPVYGDVTRMQQVVWNLLGNAAKFTPPGGLLSIEVQAIDGEAVVRVCDSGCGIDPAVLPQLFVRFWQATSGTTRSHGGLGLGLSIVRQLVELHGGTVSAFSEGFGRGATFTVRLPLASDAIVERTPAPANDASQLAGLRVLLVDDDEGFGQLIQRLLREYRIEVAIATSAKKAFAALDAFCPHLLLSDIGMPDVDGYEFVRQVRAGGKTASELPAAAVSAFGGEHNRERAKAAGFQAYVSKPVEVTTLIATLVDLLAHRREATASR